MARYWYAVYCPYGARTLSDGDVLYRFKSKFERDKYVDEVEKMQSVTRAEARCRFRPAFEKNIPMLKARRVGRALYDIPSNNGDPYWAIMIDGRQMFVWF